MSADLARFRQAQDEHATFVRALAEIVAGEKRSHWMWFVFPQIAGLGTSPTARFFAIRGTAEARAYLAEAVLRQRLLTITAAACSWAGKRSLDAIFGTIDALKFVSSMTLFEAIAEQRDREHFSTALEALANGRRDRKTLALIEGGG